MGLAIVLSTLQGQSVLLIAIIGCCPVLLPKPVHAKGYNIYLLNKITNLLKINGKNSNTTTLKAFV
jgi:hypothetical protein